MSARAVPPLFSLQECLGYYWPFAFFNTDFRLTCQDLQTYWDFQREFIESVDQ